MGEAKILVERQERHCLYSLSPATIPSCMAPVTADTFFFGAVTLPPLDDDNHDFSETQEDEDQVSASSQRTLRERPVKQSKKGQDMNDWSLVKSRGNVGEAVAEIV
ncbi:hypothetical protein YC2023_122383 [Brassica napus]